MKIAVSSDSSNLSARVAQRFGISPYLIIVDPETMEIEAVPNPGAAGKQVAGIQAVVIAISKEVDTVLTGYCSPTVMKYLADNGIDVVTGVKGTVAEAVAQYRKQAHAIPARSMDEPDFAGAALLHALKRSGLKKLIFPGCVLMIYGIVFIISPAGASMAFRSSTAILLNLVIPFGLVFMLMVFMNLFLKPTHIVRFLGKESSSRSIILSAAAGIISMGPIYAWYPLLKELRKKGAANSLIAVFLGNRAVKPFLLPIMISYFGWVYVALLTLFTVSGSLAVGYLVNTLAKD